MSILCTESTCTHIILNDEATKVCSKYGVCFGQKLCDTQQQSKDHIITTNMKRDQQIGNKKLSKVQIQTWVRSLLVHATLDAHIDVLTEQINRLWIEIVEISNKTGIVVHRRYRRCVATAVIGSLNTGLSTRTGPVIAIHSGKIFKMIRFNKRHTKLSSEIFVSDIRSGQRVLKMIFDDHICNNVIKID